MAIFPELNPSSLTEEDLHIRARMQAVYDRSIQYNMAYWQAAGYDHRFYAGDQSAFQEIGYATAATNRKKQFYFNRIKPIVSMITGHQRKNRKSTVVVPIENADEVTANQFSKILMWISQKEGIGETISEAFEGAVIGGMTLLHPWMDYRYDPINGDLRLDSLAYNEFFIDPFCRKINDLSDCQYIWKRSYISKEDAVGLLPGMYDKIMETRTSGARDDKFNRLPENFALEQTNLNTYDEYYYRTYRTQRLLVDTQTGGTFEWKSTFEDKLDQFLAMYPQLTLLENQVPTYNVAILLNGQVMYNGVQPSGLTELPFVPVVSYYNPNLTDFASRVQGVVRGLIDSQYLFNRRRNIELAMLESQISSGWKYKADALVNPKDVFLSGEGRGMAIKQNASMEDVQQIVPAGIHPSVLQLSENLGREMERISGVSEELLGSASDDKAGILAMVRQGASLTALQGLFDNLDRSQKRLGKLFIDLIQNNFTPGKVQRIIEEQPADEFYNKAFSSYDCAVEEGVLTTTQRQMQLVQLVELKQIGVNIPDDVLLNAITLQNKKELVDRVMQEKQAASDLQQMQLQTTLKEAEARTELAMARAAADHGLANERTSRVPENIAMAEERRSQSVSNENLALLNLVKALKEIDTMDIQHIEKLITMQSMIKQQEAQKEAQSAAENQQVVTKQEALKNLDNQQSVPQSNMA